MTQNYDAAGRVSVASATETKTTLKEAGAERFTLVIESTVELDGKRIVSEPQQVTQRYNGALAGQMASSRLLRDEALTIGDKSYPCSVHQYEISGGGQKTITRTHYSAETAPYVLRRETRAIEGNTVSSHVLVEVKELNVPHRACGQVLPAARMVVQQTHAKGKETTEALSSVRVPGGVIWHDSTLVDGDGKKLSHSTLELLDFHVVPREPAPDAGARRWPDMLSLRADPCWSLSRGGLFSRCRWLRGGH
jgi:hypothetical protein